MKTLFEIEKIDANKDICSTLVLSDNIKTVVDHFSSDIDSLVSIRKIACEYVKSMPFENLIIL